MVLSPSTSRQSEFTAVPERTPMSQRSTPRYDLSAPQRASANGDSMSSHIEELDRKMTDLGEIVLRRRLEPTLLVDVYEVKLGDEYLMSSLFTASETQLAKLTLAALEGTALDIAVGGLGLGYTAYATLNDERVRSLYVIEAVPEVIDWHHRHLVPLATTLTSDRRCHFVESDFFATIAADDAFGPNAPYRVHAVIVDIDHTPQHHLHPRHAAFYTPEGLRHLAVRLLPGGVFALWSDDPPDSAFMAAARQVFASCEAQVISFPNPLTGGESSNTVYISRIDHG
ncbi:MAG: spermidine synthase [Acidimicrobiales bacterium]